MAIRGVTISLTSDISPDYVIGQWPELDERELALLQWWAEVAIADFDAQLPKMHEYGARPQGGGSADLQLIGDSLAQLLDWQDVPSAVAQELGAWLYAQGKIARLVSDYRHKKPGKPDTWHDLTVYAMIARRLQEVGAWP